MIKDTLFLPDFYCYFYYCIMIFFEKEKMQISYFLTSYFLLLIKVDILQMHKAM